MDRLNQLRGDAGASRDSTLDTSSLASEAYMTANDSSKYFSLSQVDSSTLDSPTKKTLDIDTTDCSTSSAERITSNLSPIPKKSEINSFKIGEQIEAANILSGGVNIFDDNENSYDGDELVIDDAVAEGEDKPTDLKLDENDVTFEKSDRLADTSMEDAEAGVPNRDTEVVLQIDGKNVDAIDIGNGLYLYRRDGEEELAAVQILDDNQQQPDIKFLKVRENAEGNLEVYEEIEIEVPKEVPTKEGKAVKNTSHIPVKDVTLLNEPVSNKVAENNSKAESKDTALNELELELNKDNTHTTECRTEVNLNGKMMKFSESRKSPLIGTFTPMTYHSTPNKEGIPLTKTMVDLQLHPNRHSEIVKKTIEVHTDNCKQRLLETPAKATKDSNEHNKSLEFGSCSLDKDVTDYFVDGVDQICKKNIKDLNKELIENKTAEIIALKSIDDKNINDVTLQNQQTEQSHKDNFKNNVKDNKTEIKDIKKHHLALEKPTVDIVSQCKSNSSNFSDEGNEKLSTKETPLNKTSFTISNENDKIKTQAQTRSNKDDLLDESAHRECSESEDIKINDDITKRNSSIVKEIENANVSNEKDNVQNKEQNVGGVNRGNDIISNITTLNIIESHIVKSDNFLKTPQSSSNNSNHEIIEVNKPLEILDSSTKSVKLINNLEIKDSKNHPIKTLKISPDNKNSEMNTVSESCAARKGTEILGNKKQFEEDSTINQRNLKPAEIKNDTTLVQQEPVVNIINKSPKKELKTVSELKEDQNEDKINLSEVVNMKSSMESKTDKLQNDPFSKVHQYSKNIIINDLKTTSNKNKPDKLSQELGSKVNAKSNQLEVTTSKIITRPSKLSPNAEVKSLHKDLLNTEQNSIRNSHLIIKPNTTEKYNSTKISLLSSNSKLSHAVQNISKEVERSKNESKKEIPKDDKMSIPKPINNNKSAVPFGKWTEANRQEFLNKIKESKVPINTSSTKQLKQPNDLNRRDVLQKIDSQRQSNIASTKIQDLNILNKIKHKQDAAAFTSKPNVSHKEKTKDNKVTPSHSKAEATVSVPPAENKIVLVKKVDKEQSTSIIPVDMSSSALSIKKDPAHRKEINNQDIIDKTIEGIINRAVTAKSSPDEVKQAIEPAEKLQNAISFNPVSLDDIESKMNELHGIPFVERPPHELPQVFEHENKSIVCDDKDKELKVNLPATTKANAESDEEMIEHQPLTGDIELNKNNVLTHKPTKDRTHPQETITTKGNCDSKKEPIITENDFDKFARRNSITYENCLTVSFDGKEHHNVIQTVVEKEPVSKKLSRNEIMLAESKAKSHKQLAMRHINFSSKIPTATKTTHDEDTYSKNYQSKVQIAYQTVMTAKRQQECPITIIEDKPVKVVFMDGSHEFIPHQLNVQGKELSPPKKSTTEWDHFTHSNSESLDSDILDPGNDSKSQDDNKYKSKHQRKQVLTPVEAPDLELIEPGDLGIQVSPKKKRKIEDKPEKNSKSLVPKKSYLLNRNIMTDDAPSNSQDLIKTPLKESSSSQHDLFVTHSDPISAIDNLVKAAELLETQSESKHVLSDQNSPTQQNTPIKRGRGRPRKYPLPEPGTDSKSPSSVKTPTPQKKPRLIDAKSSKHETESEDDEINSDGELIKENWTMGKINENIVCPICNKLFRSENVVFKHVKHCTGPSPSRSDSDKSPRRMRQSQELDWKSEDGKSDSMDVDEDYEINKPTNKRKSKEKRSSIDALNKSDDKNDIIVIEDTPVKDSDSPIRKRERLKHESNKDISKAKVQHRTSNLVCEICGKTFRQLSYLVNHKLQHKNAESKKIEEDKAHKSLFSCEICKKEFRKLHHLVQHRIIHNSNPIRTSRKSSSEQSDNKSSKEVSRATEDQSAGFRCEPCDKSFRKLHHLVEHRETHDEINKKCNPVSSSVGDTTKPTPLHHCDICKKTFKKLQHLIEHKEHHLDTCSEKSDDKSVKSSLSTKDIIHECPLCYMVFPNEHSLNKHHIICQRKKKQSKQMKQINENDVAEADDESKAPEACEENLAITERKEDTDTSCIVIEDQMPIITDNQENNIIAKPLDQKKEVDLNNDVTPAEMKLPLELDIDNSTTKKDGPEFNGDKVSVKSKKVIPTVTPVEVITISDTPSPKKKLLAKNKLMGPKITKRQRAITDIPLPVAADVKTPDSSDDDEIRYMLNPDFQIDASNEDKLFMKVRGNKRSSLQIERPNSKDLMKRRISLQHPPKIPRLKMKPILRKPINTNTVLKSSKVLAESLSSTDSDDSDVKYSFPETVMTEITKEAQKKAKKQKIVEKRKSLSNIAKRKSLGKVISVKQKVKPSPVKQIKKRTADAEHRCDCGQLFSSAALLARHTSLAHTPPRIRRRRSVLPDIDKPTVTTQKRIEKPQEKRKTVDAPSKSVGVTTRKTRSTPHKGVPVPEKMRKLMEKSKK